MELHHKVHTYICCEKMIIYGCLLLMYKKIISLITLFSFERGNQSRPYLAGVPFLLELELNKERGGSKEPISSRQA